MKMYMCLLPVIGLLALATFSPAAVPGADILGGLVLKHFDSNSDGSIDTGEWQGGMAASFTDMDLNRDGSVSGDDVDGLKKEMSDELGEVGATVAVALIKQIVLTLDKNADKVVTEKEFAEGGEAMFKKLDANNDSKLTKEELAEMPARLLN
ncbi:MAG: hypothetical protein K1X78_18610 [Verrucomicrobiaceae bacterium]|nr:hypothetical protein [Verrucomicrobiaceae bacterium]